MVQFNLKLNSLQQKLSLTSNYLGTNSVILRKVDGTQLESSVIIIRDEYFTVVRWRGI